MKKILVLTILFLGCAKSDKDLNVTQTQYEPTIQKFDVTQSLEFTSNTFFFWKEDIKGDEVARVSQLSYGSGLLEQKAVELEISAQPLKQAIAQATVLSKTKAKIEEEKASKEKELSELPEEERDNSPLKKDIAAAQKKMEEIDEQLAPLNKVIAEMGPQVEAAQKALKAQADGIKKELATLVEFTTAPQKVSFTLTEEGLQVQVLDWDPQDGLGVRSFTARNVQYEAMGGYLQFLVDVGSGYSYLFELMRTDLQNPLGKIRFSGDVTRFRHQDKTRYGMMKVSN